MGGLRPSRRPCALCGVFWPLRLAHRALSARVPARWDQRLFDVPMISFCVSKGRQAPHGNWSGDWDALAGILWSVAKSCFRVYKTFPGILPTLDYEFSSQQFAPPHIITCLESQTDQNHRLGKAGSEPSALCTPLCSQAGLWGPQRRGE